jgi:hypothetical protein
MASQSLSIVNYCQRDYPGLHWLALSKEGDRLEVFDSYGLHPSVYRLMDKLPDFSSMAYNTRQLQSVHSKVCGHYCLYYLFYKARGFALGDIMAKFSNDYANNDIYVERIVFDLYNL